MGTKSSFKGRFSETAKEEYGFASDALRSLPLVPTKQIFHTPFPPQASALGCAPQDPSMSASSTVQSGEVAPQDLGKGGACTGPHTLWSLRWPFSGITLHRVRGSRCQVTVPPLLGLPQGTGNYHSPGPRASKSTFRACMILSQTILLILGWWEVGQLFVWSSCWGLGCRGTFTEVPLWCETELAMERKLARGTSKLGAFLCCPLWT